MAISCQISLGLGIEQKVLLKLWRIVSKVSKTFTKGILKEYQLKIAIGGF